MFAAAVTSQRGRSFAVFGARTPVRRHGQTTIEHEQVIVPELIVAFPVLVKVRLHSPLEGHHVTVPLLAKHRRVHVASNAARTVHHDRAIFLHVRQRSETFLHVRIHRLTERFLHRTFGASKASHVPLVSVSHVQQQRRVLRLLVHLYQIIVPLLRR